MIKTDVGPLDRQLDTYVRYSTLPHESVSLFAAERLLFRHQSRN